MESDENCSPVQLNFLNDRSKNSSCGSWAPAHRVQRGYIWENMVPARAPMVPVLSSHIQMTGRCSKDEGVGLAR